MENSKAELEMQLHEQYANNRNSILGGILALFVAMLSVIGAYGNVFLKTHVPECQWCDHHFFTLDGLAWTAAAAIFVMFVIAWICIELGYLQRREQFIIDTIRKQHYTEKEYYKIFPKNYNPFDKGKISAMPTPYDVLFKISHLVAILVFVSFCIKILLVSNETALVMLLLVLLLSVICFFIVGYKLLAAFYNYSTYQDYYRGKDVFQKEEDKDS